MLSKGWCQHFEKNLSMTFPVVVKISLAQIANQNDKLAKQNDRYGAKKPYTTTEVVAGKPAYGGPMVSMPHASTPRLILNKPCMPHLSVPQLLATSQ